MKLPPILFHGTSPRNLNGILADGLLPGQNLGKSVYADMRPLSPYVYLSYPLAIQYAAEASKNEEQFSLIKIDTSYLDQEKLRPDEDLFFDFVLDEEGVLPSGNPIADTEMVLYRMENEASRFRESLLRLGNVAYQGLIPLSAIIAVSTYENGLDRAGIMAHYQDILGDSNGILDNSVMRRHKGVLARIFGQRVSINQILGQDRTSRTSGAELRNMQNLLDLARPDVRTIRTS
ncbi:MAG: hypothetical protein JST51_20190 [Armatimonadetes bacterium]|nr:hypothetical protein [Armatimonadota bacterium]